MTLHSYTKDEVAKFVLEKYGKGLNLTDLDSSKKLLSSVYSDIASICKEEKVPYDDIFAGKLIVGMLEAIEEITTEITKRLKFT